MKHLLFMTILSVSSMSFAASNTAAQLAKQTLYRSLSATEFVPALDNYSATCSSESGDASDHPQHGKVICYVKDKKNSAIFELSFLVGVKKEGQYELQTLSRLGQR